MGEVSREQDRPATQLQVSGLSDSIISNILLRLPMKALCKFKCASKAWLSLISSPYFIKRHKNLRQIVPLLIFSRFVYDEMDETSIHITSMDLEGRVHNYFIKQAEFGIDALDFGKNSVQIVACCDLILYAFAKRDFEERVSKIYVCNSRTLEFVDILEKYPADIIGAMTARPVQQVGLESVALGYQTSTDEYKLVILIPCFDASDKMFNCGILTIRDDGLIPDDADDCITFFDISINWYMWFEHQGPAFKVQSSICIDSIMYWILVDTSGPMTDIANWILSIDLQTEEFELVAFPDERCKSITTWTYIRNLRNSVCLVHCLPEPNTTEIWLLEDLKAHKWTLRHTIDISEIKGADLIYAPEMDGRHDGLPVDIIYEDEGKEEILVDVNHETLYCYDLKSRSFKAAEQFDISGLGRVSLLA